MSSFKEYFYRNIGLQIRKYRILHGLSQEKLADILNLNTKYIGHVERCERHISTKVLAKLLDMWEIQPSDFFKFEQNFEWE